MHYGSNGVYRSLNPMGFGLFNNHAIGAGTKFFLILDLTQQI